jgi:hypothetical protein
VSEGIKIQFGGTADAEVIKGPGEVDEQNDEKENQ